MLGEQVGDVRGQTISTRVLPDEGTGPRMEITDQSVGTLCGVSITSTVTYVGTLGPTGHIAGEGTGTTYFGAERQQHPSPVRQSRCRGASTEPW